MATIHPQDCNEVKVDIVEQKQQEKQPMTNQLEQKSVQTKKQLSIKETIKYIMIGICIYLLASEMILFGVKQINKTPTNAFLYRYQILPYCLMIGVAFFGFISIVLVPPMMSITVEFKPKFWTFARHYCTRKDKPASIRWYQQKWFVKSVVIICLLFMWLITLEIGHMFFIIGDTMEKQKVLDRFTIHYVAGAVLFIFWIFTVFGASSSIIMEWIVEHPSGLID